MKVMIEPKNPQFETSFQSCYLFMCNKSAQYRMSKNSLSGTIS